MMTLLEALCWEDDHEQCNAATEIRTMCRAIDHGADPKMLLAERGLKPYHMEELLNYYSDYMDEQEARLEASDSI
jgi:hypothetical protein